MSNQNSNLKMSTMNMDIRNNTDQRTVVGESFCGYSDHSGKRPLCTLYAPDVCMYVCCAGSSNKYCHFFDHMLPSSNLNILA